MKKSLLFGLISLFLAVSLSGQEQVPNGNLENWTDTLGFDDPDHWQTPNMATMITGIFTTTKTTDAAQGTFAAKLESKNISGFVSPGVITLGTFTVDYVNNTAYLTGGIPFTDKPLALKGSYKNFPAAGDSTLIAVLFTRYLQSKGKKDTVGFGAMYSKETVDTWTNFSIPITFFGDFTPDTMNLHVVSSNMLEPNQDSYMFIDALAFEYEAGIGDIENVVETSIFPNPAGNELTFSLQKEVNAELRIFNQEGRLVFSTGFEGMEKKLDVSGFAAGNYYFGLFERSRKISSGQFVINR